MHKRGFTHYARLRAAHGAALLGAQRPLAADASGAALFAYEDRREPLAAYGAAPSLLRREVLSVAELLDAAARADAAVYASLALNASAPAGHAARQLADSFGADWPLLRDAATALCGPAAQTEHVWLGSAQSSAHWHYDSSDNIYMQVRGAKRWQLAPPAAHAHVDVFPHVHPSARQLLQRREDAMPSALVSSDLVLRAGDVLLIPAYYWHRVTTVEVRICRACTCSLPLFSFYVLLFTRSISVYIEIYVCACLCLII